MIQIVIAGGVAYVPNDVGDIVKQYCDAKQYQHMKKRLRKAGVFVSLSEQVVEAVHRCAIVDVYEFVRLMGPLNFKKTSFGLTPILIGPAVMAIEGVRFGEWKVDGSTMRMSVSGESVNMLCGKQDPSGFDILVAAAVMRYSCSNVSVKAVEEHGEKLMAKIKEQESRRSEKGGGGRRRRHCGLSSGDGRCLLLCNP